MNYLTLSPGNTLLFSHVAPTNENAPTFVFVNALTGNTDTWEASVAPSLRERGFGTLSYNFRGQEGSDFAHGVELTPTLIVDDLMRLIAARRPVRPILVGLSIGGIFAAHAVLRSGAPVSGLVLLNTLREIGPRIAWVNDALEVIVGAGGVNLFMDALLPLLMNEEFTAKARPNFLKGDYAPLDPAHGHMNLMRNAVATEWNIPYEALALPVLVITGHQDRVFLDPEIVDRLYARLPVAEREDWANAGHLLPQERPKRLAESLARFGTRISGAGL